MSALSSRLSTPSSTVLHYIFFFFHWMNVESFHFFFLQFFHYFHFHFHLQIKKSSFPDTNSHSFAGRKERMRWQILQWIRHSSDDFNGSMFFSLFFYSSSFNLACGLRIVDVDDIEWLIRNHRCEYVNNEHITNERKAKKCRDSGKKLETQLDLLSTWLLLRNRVATELS